jgi:predicted Rossmann-fold nucleotide-binding protein
LNVEGYFDHLIRFMDHALEEGFLKPVHRDRLLVGEDPGALLDQLNGYRAPDLDKWLDRSST